MDIIFLQATLYSSLLKSIKYCTYSYVVNKFIPSPFFLVAYCGTGGIVLCRALLYLSIYKVWGGRTTHIKGFLIRGQQEISKEVQTHL